MARLVDSHGLQNGILKRLYFKKNQSCAALSGWLKKSIPLVTKVLNELIADGYVITNGFAPSTGGRRPLSYSLKPDKGFILAVGMDQHFTTLVMVDLAGRQVSTPETVELNLHREKDALQTLADIVSAHIEGSGIDKEKIIGAGFGMPGFINVQEGVNYTFFDQDMKISHRSFLEKTLDMPVFIDNDSSLTALAEWTFGLAKGYKNALIINIGWGTGLGMVINGELFRGDSGYAGEFSHIPLSDNGVLCECGKRGCLETETSLLVMAEKAVEEIQQGKVHHLPLKDVKYMSDVIIELARRGDQYCIELLSQVGFMLGKGIAILIHILNPGLIVLSGRGAKAERILMSPVQQALNQYCIPRLVEHTEIVVSRLVQDAGLIGAAALVVEHVNIYQGKPVSSKNN
jgi:predicted NBD/HSP70 family sugar kinase